jgi:sigma-54-specific transcriptional regulator
MTTGAELEILETACQAKSLFEFSQLFGTAVQNKHNLYGSSYFSLNNVKDHLILVSSTLQDCSIDEPLQMSVNNTNNPIVYALVTNKPYFLKAPANLTGAGEAFNTMTKTLSAEMAIQCFPIALKNNGGMLGVFVFIAPDAVLQQMHETIVQDRLFNVFSSILGLYKCVEKNNQEKDLLKIDFKHKTANDYKKTIQQQIARRFIGRSQIIQEVWDLLAKAAVSEIAIMLRGETGVGKDLAASIIHDYSSRADESFIVVNCASIPENLLESELFGHCKGAFTGANHDKQGMIAMADKGTLFLDEIGDLSPVLQAKLLRVLQEKKFIPIGAKKEIHSDFRLITATHRPIEQWVRDEKFRQDLFYRINQFGITLPKLSDRKADVPQIVTHFINQYIKENNVHISGCSETALKVLKKYRFPGNVRELRNIVFQACLFVDSKDKKINKQNITERLANMVSIESPDTAELVEGVNSDYNSLTEACEAFELKIIRTALIESGGSRTKAAIKLKIPKRTLAYKCQKWSINAENS